MNLTSLNPERESTMWLTKNGAFLNQLNAWYEVEFDKDKNWNIVKEVPEDVVFSGMLIPIIHKRKQ